MLDPVETNDLGEFRIFRLPPGMYYLAAAAVTPAMQNGRVDRLYQQTAAAIFFPGVRRAADAVRLNVAEGETRADLALTPAGDASVISGDIATAPSQAGFVQFYPMPRGTDARFHSAFNSMFGHSLFDTRRSGTSFTLSNVFPSALVPLTVDGRNVTGIVTRLRPIQP